MKLICKRFFFFLLFSAILLPSFAQLSKLKVIPEVQKYLRSSKTTLLPNNLTILIEKDNADSLRVVAEHFKEELINYGVSTTIELSDATSAEENQLLMRYKTGLKNNEAYNLSIFSGIKIEGATQKAVFWGTRTLLQLIDNYNKELPNGIIYDYPDFPSRGFMLDAGRKGFPIEFLRHYVKMMSYYKMNEFQIHLNDNGFKKSGQSWDDVYAAFRLESEKYPELTAKDCFYTKNEFRDLQLLGMQYQVNVIPEIDVPAHSLAFTRYRQDFISKDASLGEDHLDITNKNVYAFLDTLFAEYISGENPCFVGPDVHIGTDEYSSKYAVEFRNFTNYYLNYIQKLGKRPRLWGSLRAIQADVPVVTDNAVSYAWNQGWSDPIQAIKNGFSVMNICDAWLYIVPKAGYYRDFLDVRWLHNNFSVLQINPKEKLTSMNGVLGAMFAVWNDKVGNGLSIQDVHYRVFPAMQVLSDKLWKQNPLKSYDEYVEVSNSCGEGQERNMIGHFSDAELALLSSKITSEEIFDGQKEYDLLGGDLGYNYSVSFDLQVANNNSENTILFQSDFSKITLNTNGTGKIGFYRDGYQYYFNFQPNGEWQSLKFIGDYESVSLYVDGKMIEYLGEIDKDGLNYQQTLYFPIQKVGDKMNGFIGKIRNLVFENYELEDRQKEFEKTKVQIPSGVYQITYNGKYLTNANPNGSGECPVFKDFIDGEGFETQLWNFIYVEATNRYKFTSYVDDRVVNEIGNFSTKPYSDAYNTYQFYKLDNLYAMQNAGAGGTSFWRPTDSDTRLRNGSSSYKPTNYFLGLRKVDPTAIHCLTLKNDEVDITAKGVKVLKDNIQILYLYNLNGSLLKSVKKSSFLPFNFSNTSMMYLLKAVTGDGKTFSFQIKR